MAKRKSKSLAGKLAESFEKAKRSGGVKPSSLSTKPAKPKKSKKKTRTRRY